MFFLETDGSLTIVFDPSSSVEELITAFKYAIDGQSLLYEAFLLQHPSLPSGYFTGALVTDNFFAVSALPPFVSAYQILESIIFLGKSRGFVHHCLRGIQDPHIGGPGQLVYCIELVSLCG
jgi:hypothetical protein